MLIGLTGRAQAGKDTVFERLSHSCAGPTCSVQRLSFADLLYESAAAALGVEPGVLRRLKTDPSARLVLQFNAEKAYAGSVASITVREYLQRYGTEAHRELFGEDFWVNALRLDRPFLADSPGGIYVVTDVRFENEAQAVHRARGIVVRVVGPASVETVADGHASEAGVPEHLIDLTLDNSVRDDDFRGLDRQLIDVVRVAGSVRRAT